MKSARRKTCPKAQLEIAYQDGYDEGHKDGYNEGFEEGRAEAIKKVERMLKQHTYFTIISQADIAKWIKKNYQFTADNTRPKGWKIRELWYMVESLKEKGVALKKDLGVE